MASEWRLLAAEEFCASVRDGTHDSPKPVEHGRSLVTSRHITGGRLDLGNGYLISQEDFDAINKRSKVDRWDVLISMIGTVDEPCLIRDEPDFAIKNIGLFKCKGEVEGKWLYYYLRTADAQQLIREQARGTTQQYIPLGVLREFPVPVPSDPDEMRAVTHILGTLDDKIDLNRRMSETLEAMARALFKSWFVDFDPVRAKAEGRDLGLPKPLADLFPARLVDSELGEIPEGWEVRRVGDIGTIVCGKTPPTQVSDYYGHDVPFITIPDMHGRIFATSVQKRLSRAGAQSQERKMLPVGAVCVSCIATAGLVVITSEPSQTNQQINSVVPNQNDATYFWYWTLRNLGDDIRAGGSGGSVLTNLSTGRFGELRLLASVTRLRSYYHSIVAPVFGRILENEREVSALTALRDTLLPKLISGELRMRDAERFVGAAT